MRTGFPVVFARVTASRDTLTMSDAAARCRLLVSMPDDFSQFGLVVTTGHKAGLLLVRLPKECESAQSVGVRHEWLVSNWSTWVYPECDVAEVWLLRHYPVPVLADLPRGS